jgi:hypothetical protein
LAFESAAAIHAQVQKVESVRALASELVRPLSQLRAVILQASASPDEVAVFLFENGRLHGPARFSTLGMRIQNEQSGSSSLFAQPMTLEPVPEKQGSEIGDQGIGDQGSVKNEDLSAPSLDPDAQLNHESAAPIKIPRGMLEGRLEAALAELSESPLSESSAPPSPTVRQAHMALLKRWYYRPEARRTGEIFFPDAEGRWPIKGILRGAGRVAAKMLASVDRS